MSGLEIGGIVLGAFPLALIAIEKYQALLERVTMWKTENHRNALESFALELRVQEALFRNSYKTLLLSFMDRATVITFLTDPHEPDDRQQIMIAEMLLTKLGEQWSIYDAMMKRLQKGLERLSRELEKNTTTVDLTSLKNVKAFFGRVRFSLTIKLRDGVLGEIKSANQDFAALIMQMRTLKHLDMRQNTPKDCSMGFIKSRHILLRLLEDLSARLPCPPEQQCQHRIEIGCLPSINHYKHQQTWVFDYIDLYIRGSNEFDTSRVVTRPLMSNSMTPKIILKNLCELGNVPVSDTLRDETEFENEDEQQATNRDIPYSISRWSTTSVNISPTSTYGWHLEAEDSYWILDEPTIKRSRNLVSLREVITSNGRYSCFPRYFFEGDRSELATKLAGAVLLFGNGDWIARDWSSSDILLSADDRDVLSMHLRNPFMSFSLRGSDISRQNSTVHNQVQKSEPFGVRNQWLYSLGMTLLEILLNCPLESYRAHEGESNIQIAWRIEKLALQHGGPRWAEIIFRCLHCPYSEEPDLSSTDFILKIYQEVMEPLLGFSKLPSISQYREQSMSRQLHTSTEPVEPWHSTSSSVRRLNNYSGAQGTSSRPPFRTSE